MMQQRVENQDWEKWIVNSNIAEFRIGLLTRPLHQNANYITSISNYFKMFLFVGDRGCAKTFFLASFSAYRDKTSKEIFMKLLGAPLQCLYIDILGKIFNGKKITNIIAKTRGCGIVAIFKNSCPIWTFTCSVRTCVVGLVAPLERKKEKVDNCFIMRNDVLCGISCKAHRVACKFCIHSYLIHQFNLLGNLLII